MFSDEDFSETTEIEEQINRYNFASNIKASVM
jgi:hypothetical protein